MSKLSQASPIIIALNATNINRIKQIEEAIEVPVTIAENFNESFNNQYKEETFFIPYPSKDSIEAIFNNTIDNTSTRKKLYDSVLGKESNPLNPDNNN